MDKRVSKHSIQTKILLLLLVFFLSLSRFYQNQRHFRGLDEYFRASTMETKTKKFERNFYNLVCKCSSSPLHMHLQFIDMEDPYPNKDSVPKQFSRVCLRVFLLWCPWFLNFTLLLPQKRNLENPCFFDSIYESIVAGFTVVVRAQKPAVEVRKGCEIDQQRRATNQEHFGCCGDDSLHFSMYVVGFYLITQLVVDSRSLRFRSVFGFRSPAPVFRF